MGAALLTAYKNAGGEIDLQQALVEMMSRGRSVPGGACGFWGACGAGISAGMFVSIISKRYSSGAPQIKHSSFIMMYPPTFYFIVYMIPHPVNLPQGGQVNFFPILPELLARAPEVEELYHKFCKKGRQG